MDTEICTSKYSIIGSNVVENRICHCCLAENVTVVNLQTCKHASFLQNYYTVDCSKLSACLLCHSMLRKIEIFKNQIRSSSMVLTKHMHPSAKLNNLQRTATTFFTLPEDGTDDQPTNENEPFELLTDIKIEDVPNISDLDNDLPLSEVKKRKVKKVKHRSFPIDDKYNGKIMMFNLSRVELEEERERDSKKKSYLKLPYKCESCVKGFDHENTLKNHMDKQHSQKKGGIVCDVCKSILGAASFKEHTRRHFRRFHCMVCGKRSQDIYAISQHYNLQHADSDPIKMQFTCVQCDFTTESNRVYRYHRDKHKQKQQCNMCGNTYVSVASLRVHMLHVHKQSPRVYECSLCDKSYSSKSGLYSHNVSTHESTGAYCERCNTHFKTKTGLTHHQRTHSAHLTEQNKKFTCAECDAKYLTKAALQSHIDWDHLKTIKHECTKCSKVFKSAVTLKNHNSYVHEKRRPPRDKICDYCGRGFTTTAILRCHIRTHTGERPLRCAHCSASFAHSAALYTHTKLLHKAHKNPNTVSH